MSHELIERVVAHLESLAESGMRSHYAPGVRSPKGQLCKALAEELRGVVVVTKDWLEDLDCPNDCSDGMIIQSGPDPQHDTCPFCMMRDLALGVTRQEVDKNHQICEHGRNAFVDDCGMCELAGTNWAKPK
jgi:hypothetical protein